MSNTPNWCEGSLKVRGKIADLKNFVLNGLHPVDPLGGELEPLKFDTEDETSFSLSCVPRRDLWMKGTRRHFCNPEWLEADADDPDDPVILIIPMRAAWAILADGLQALCKEFNVDMKIQGFEMGMQFSQVIEIVNGEILKDEEIHYDDWDWDCPCPRMGG